MPQLQLCLVNILIKSKYKGSKVNHKTVTKLANIAVKKWWFYLDLSDLIHQREKAKREHLSRKNISTLRTAHIEERAKQIAESGNTKE